MCVLEHPKSIFAVACCFKCVCVHVFVCVFIDVNAIAIAIHFTNSKCEMVNGLREMGMSVNVMT